MVGFYKHDIPAWMDGTEALSDGAYRAYHVIVQMIMLNEGPITRNDRGIAGRCNTTVKAFQRALVELVEAGKLTLDGGQIANARAARELENVMKNRENAGKGGKTRAFRQETQKNPDDDAPKSLRNNDVAQAPLQTIPSLKEKRRGDSTPLPPNGVRDTEPEGFAEWFEAYPDRDGMNPRPPAAKRYASALKAGVTSETLLRAVKAYAAEMNRKKKIGTEYVKQAQFWLSPTDKLWEHYGREVAQKKTWAEENRDYLANLSDERWRVEVKDWRGSMGHWPMQARTSPPDRPDTAVPRHILAEFNIHPERRAAA